MGSEQEARAKAVLGVMADLSPSPAQQPAAAHAIPLEWFRWLPAEAVRLFPPEKLLALATPPADVRAVDLDRRFGERLQAVDQLRPGQRSLRAGWLFVAGGKDAGGGRRQRIFHPLVTIPVRVQGWGLPRLVPAGDEELTPLITDTTTRQRLEGQMEFGGGALQGVSEVSVTEALLVRLGRLRRFAQDAAAAAGLHASRLVAADKGPDELLRSDELVIVAGVGVYAVHETGGTSRAASLRAWAEGSMHEWTAFHSMYLGPLQAETPREQDGGMVESPYLLTPTQRSAVLQSRSEPVTAVSGAPGTGKSHTVAAIACDALARGQRVLMAAKSDATIDALLDLLERGPGPDPVIFGSNERREALADRLAGGQMRPAPSSDVAEAHRRLAAAIDSRDRAQLHISERLQAELLADGAETELADARLAAPLLFDSGRALDEVAQLLHGASQAGSGWLRRRRRRKTLRTLRRLTGASAEVNLDDIRRALDTARAVRVLAELRAAGGLEIGSDWERLLALEDEVRAALGTWLALESRSSERINWSSLRSIAALSTALRSGRAARREQLRRLDDDKLTRALPLWVGTLPDIDDLLPAIPALFDLVILDESSSIDQPLAAPALLRAKRAVIVGDPRQLRHVSFLSDEQLQTAVRTHGIDDDAALAARLDVRRNSTFDVAVGAVPVLTLDEHFRSDPHLVEFVSRKLYGGRVHVATRSPRSEAVDCIQCVRVDGRRDRRGVVAVEVDAVLRQLEALRRQGARSVGVVTPFRAQADALEQAALGAFSAEDLNDFDLRIGTVHAFQGNERDVVVTSLAIGPDDGPASWRFVEDPHLFTVFITRARKRLVFIHSAAPPPGGLLAEYLAQANSPPGRPKPVARLEEWPTGIAAELESAGLPVIPGYPSGRHVIDLCVGDAERYFAVEGCIHAEGPSAHIDRHLSLCRGGWDFLEAYPSRWGDRRAELIIEIVHRLNEEPR